MSRNHACRTAVVSIACDAMAAYQARALPADELAIIEQALAILGRRFDPAMRPLMGSLDEASQFLRLRLGALDIEVFGCIWLDSHNRFLLMEELARGTHTQTSVYPRELARRALALNASSVILYHNHPSSVAEASSADEALTATLKRTLSLIDVRVLDHLIVTAARTMSFASRGLL